MNRAGRSIGFSILVLAYCLVASNFRGSPCVLNGSRSTTYTIGYAIKAVPGLPFTGAQSETPGRSNLEEHLQSSRDNSRKAVSYLRISEGLHASRVGQYLLYSGTLLVQHRKTDRMYPFHGFW